MKTKISFLASALALTVIGCGGGGGSSTSTEVKGTFIDSVVQDVSYSCSPSDISGSTNELGEYTCNVGDTVTFSLGGTSLGTVTASETPVTPVTLFPNNPEAATNVAQLLQTIDSDNDASNGITPDLNLIQNLPEVIDFESEEFDTDISNALGQELISEEQAQEHLNETLVQLGEEVIASSSSSSEVASSSSSSEMSSSSSSSSMSSSSISSSSSSEVSSSSSSSSTQDEEFYYDGNNVVDVTFDNGRTVHIESISSSDTALKIWLADLNTNPLYNGGYGFGKLLGVRYVNTIDYNDNRYSYTITTPIENYTRTCNGNPDITTLSNGNSTGDFSGGGPQEYYVYDLENSPCYQSFVEDGYSIYTGCIPITNNSNDIRDWQMSCTYLKTDSLAETCNNLNLNVEEHDGIAVGHYDYDEETRECTYTPNN